MFRATRALRQAAAHAERTPLIRFVGRRHQIPKDIDHTPQPHPESPTHSLPPDFTQPGGGNTHKSFSAYRDHAQQHGPLRKTFSPVDSIGGQSGSHLGPVEAPKGMYFDRDQLPERFRRSHLSAAEIEAIESGGAALFG